MDRRRIRNDPDRAERVIRFLEKLPIIDGPAMGQRMVLGEWQRQWIRDIYSPHYEDTGRRVVRRALLSVARKNSKSFLVAGLLLCHLCGPESEPNGQVFSAAIDREQAGVIFDMCAKMIRMTPSLERVLKIIDSTKRIIVKRSDLRCAGSFYKALSAEVATKHGLGPSFFVYDEFGEARETDELWDTLLDGMQNRVEPLAVSISTQNPSPTHPFSQLCDDGRKGEDPTIVAHVHAAPEGCELDDVEAIKAANPALADWKSIDPILIAAAEAKRLPAKEQNYRRRYLNQRVSKHASLIAAADWKAREAAFELQPGEEIYLAYDGAIRTDLAALVAVSARDGSRVKAWAFKPAEHIRDHSARDGVRYDLWVDQGFVQAVPGRSIDPMAVAMKVAELTSTYTVLGLCYDRWKIDEFLRCLDSVGLLAQQGEGRGLRVEPWGQGFRDMSVAVDAFEHAVLEGELQHDGNPVLTWNVLNAVAISDPAGNRKLDKSKAVFKIDLCVALTMALGLKARDRSTAPPVNPWEDPEFSLMKSYA